MAIKVSVKGKIVYNGKEYASAVDLPEDIRRAYERAIGASPDSGDAHSVTVAKTKIVFNSQEFGSVDEMPANVRRMYDAVMVAVEEGSIREPAAVQTSARLTDPVQSRAGGILSAPPIGPESSGSKTLIAVAVAGVLLLLYLLSGRVTSR